MDPLLLAKLARQALVFAGGLLVSRGVLSQDQATTGIDALFTIAGAAMTAAPVAWAIYRHFRPTAATVAQVNAASAK